LLGAPLEFENGILKSIQMSSFCDTCFQCTHACPSQALKRWGELMTVEDMIKVIKEDSSFYRKTGGGVTLSGGEVMVQWEVAAMLLKACKTLDISTCVETALNCPHEHMEAVYEFADLVITDIKHMNSEIHKALTGVGNELILDNIKRTAEMGKKLVIRTPVVSGYNGDEANMRASGAFIRDELHNKIVQYQLLPFRKIGAEKYDSLGIPYPLGDYRPPERSAWEKDLMRYADILVNEYGVPAVPGSGRKLAI
jgi:pyruvate formate lyase activating enzyme